MIYLEKLEELQRHWSCKNGKSKGSLIAFSTEAGEVADDGDSKNSLYTKILSKFISSNIEIKKVFQNVRTEMSKLTGQVQKNIQS